MLRIKNIYATVTDHIQMAGYREIVEINARTRGLAGFVFNDVDGSVKLMASGTDAAINDFVQDLKAQRPDTVVEVMEIVESIKLPSPFGRIIIDEMREISERLDKGNKILGEMNIKIGTLNEISSKLETLDVISNKLETLDVISNNLVTLDVISNKLGTLNVISNKLDTLPERIAEALRR